MSHAYLGSVLNSQLYNGDHQNSYATTQSSIPATTGPSPHHLLPSALSSTQSSHVPIYAPTAPTAYQNEVPRTSAPPRSSYSSAQENGMLPKLAPMSNGNRKYYDTGINGIKREYESRSPPSQETSPKHVVGSQGRRGVLPCSTGRPISNQPTNGGKVSPPLAKDADGKYPCPHCSKPYLHAKHLKRHMLRRKFVLIMLTHKTNT